MSPRLIVSIFLLAMALVVIGVAGLTLTSLTQNRSDLDRVAQSVRTSDAYWAALNSAISANLYASRLDAGTDPEARPKFVNALLGAFQATRVIKETGTQEDRELIATLERRFSAPISEGMRLLNDPSANPSQPSSFDAGAIMTEIQEALSEPAARQREQALQDLTSFRSETQTRSIAIMVALGLGFVAIGVVVFGVRHYERKAIAHEAELRTLREAALVDSISQLGNHRAFQEELQRAWANSESQGTRLVLALSDIDDFKQTNDTHGHAYGDSVLAEYARLMKMILPEARAFRIGGDEFALVIADRGLEDALPDMQRILSLVSVALDGVSVSIGLSSDLALPVGPDELRQMADVALYAAKHRGKNQIVIYDDSLDRERRNAAEQAAELDRTLNAGEVQVVFQPIYNLRDGRLLACEALARLPDSLLSGPAEAFAVAGKTGSSWALDKLCLTAALHSAQSLPSDVMLFLNLDPRSLRDPHFAASEVAILVRNSGLAPSQIVLELTEHSAVPGETLDVHLSSLRREGFAVALDDVGAGNAGLQLLRTYRFDYVKVDASVVQAASQTATNGRAVLMAILAFAAESNAHVIAEGVETEENAAMLRQPGTGADLQVEAVQGFLLSKPQASIEAILRQRAQAA
jgi:diguanylate cyclase (GGDEF)-like protein